jgi:superfamily II DNA/RNA helicase
MDTLDTSSQTVEGTVGSDSKMSVDVAKESSAAYTISRSVIQRVHICAAHKKPRLLIKYLERVRSEEKANEVRQTGSVLIFCTKIKTLNFVADFLKKQGIKVEIIHGQLQQHQVRFKSTRLLT